MAYSYVEYVGNGSAQNFNVPFAYLDASDIEVYVGGVLTPHTLTSSNTVSLATAPASGVLVRVARATDAASRIVNFQDGSVLREADLDKSADQVFYLAQEAVDRADESISRDASGVYDAQNRRIGNVAAPVNPGDVVTLATMQYEYPAVETVAPFASSIKQVAEAITGGSINETDLGFITDEVTSTEGEISDLSKVASAIDEVVLVADNISSVIDVSENIAAVQTASANALAAQAAADAAADSAAEAQSIISHFTISTSDPTGGVDGDVWFKVTA